MCAEESVFMLLTCLQPDIQKEPAPLKSHFSPALSFLPLCTLHLYSPLFPLSASFFILLPRTSFHLSSSLQSCCETHQRWQSVFLMLQVKIFSNRISTRFQAQSGFFEQINPKRATEEGSVWL